MSKKNVIRRALALGFCLLLAIAALLFPSGTAAVRAGAGNGTNAKIETAAELSALLEQVVNQMEDAETGPRAVSTASKPSETPEYKSVTVEDTLQINLNVEDGRSSSRSRIDRKMTAYLMEDATYYVSEVTLSSSEKTPKQTVNDKVVQEEVNNKVNSTLRIHIYHDREVCMILFDRLTSIVNGTTHTLPASVRGKWIAFAAGDDYGIYEESISLDEHNFAVLELIGDMLAVESNFDRSGDTYKMTDRAFTSFFAGIARINGVSSYAMEDFTGKGSFVANLKNSRRPRVTLDCKDSASGDLSYRYGTSSKVSIDLAQTEELAFSNINNTVVKGPSAKGALTPEEFEEECRDFFEE